jgi:4-amino-4-deoxy-L-arabinose transferase-like glycosyltransferase
VTEDLAPVMAPRRRPLGLELALVVIVALAVLVPGISRYSLVDPWETHYGEVARMMLQEHDWVHLDWPQDGEGFRSKPVLTFWMMATGMRAVGLARDGGYSGEMEHDARTMVAIRLPFIAFGVLGLVLVWWMLARLVSRRLAWLSLLVVGSTPFFCLIARQGIPDMPLCATVMGAIAMFIMAIEDGDRPAARREVWSMLGVCGGFVVVQAIYYAIYFALSPRIAVRVFPYPAVFLPLMMAVMLAAMVSPVWHVIRVPFIYPVRVLAFPVVWACGGDWAATAAAADKLLGMQPIATMRQVYMLWAYALLGVGILAKGPPGMTVVIAVAFFYVVLFARWRELYDGAFEIKRGLLLMIVIFLPWHLGMWLKEGVRFIDEYLFTHILNRAAADPDKSLGTFEYYTSQIGHGMWLWAALLPPAVAGCLLRARTDTREGRVRFIIGLWAVCGVAVFGLVQTKFHHYILPAVPALGILVAFFLDDVLARRDRLHPIWALLGIGIVLLVTRDLMWEPDRWIELFTYRYDRPWPSAEPWSIDPSDGFLALGIIASVALAVAALPWRRFGVAALGLAGLAICTWSLQVYMPIAGQHWGMRDAVHTYYEQREIYGEKLVYFGAGEVYDDWDDVGTKWTFETFIPDSLQVGQPMTLTVELNKPDNDRVMEQSIALTGTVSRIGEHDVEVTLPPSERKKLDPWIARGKAKGERGRSPIRAVDADRLIAWQLYWRGENFWSGEEIYAWLPEMKTAFTKTDNVDFLKYLGDRTRTPLGRRYFLITEAGRATSVRSMLPTQRAKDSFEVLDTTSNKFTLVAFYL